jgi:AraC family transcriptional regulator
MNYRKDFETCFEYIEQHLKEDLTSTSLSEYIGYSLFHFCRIFLLYKEMSPSDYIRKRKLEHSLLDVMAGRKIIDVAMDYGFETHSGYTKAFKKEYGITPTQYTKKMAMYHSNQNINTIDDYIMYPKIVNLDSFVVTGYGIKTDISSTQYAIDIVAFWKDYDDNMLEEKLYSFLNPSKHGEIGIAVPNSLDSGNMTYLFGVMATPNEVEPYIPKDDRIFWHSVTVDCGVYAVFTTPPVDMITQDSSFATIIKKTWYYIFNSWLPNNDYEFDDTRYDFEYYDERCHYLTNSVMDIYIPIK